MKFKDYLKLLAAGAAIAIASSLLNDARADVITEFGVAYKYEGLTSQVLWPECTAVIITDKALPRGIGNLASCGGDNPAFVGWIVAWESEWLGQRDTWRVRAGLFHMSHWFDGGEYFGGGDEHELYGTWPAVTATFNWSNWWRNRK